MTNAFKVRYLNLGNCFLHLNENNFKELESYSSKIIELKYGNAFCKVDYFTFNGQPSVDKLGDDEIGIGSKYAQILGIANQSHVIINSCTKFGLASVYVKPKNREDKEILETCREIVERKILDQVRVVKTGQQLPIQVSRYIEIVLLIDKVEPGTLYGQLEQGTEFIVLDLPSVTEEIVKEIAPGKAIQNKTSWDKSKSTESSIDDAVQNIDKEEMFTGLSTVLPSSQSLAKSLIDEEEYNRNNRTAIILKEKLDLDKNCDLYRVLPQKAINLSSGDIKQDYGYITNKNLLGNKLEILCSLSKVAERSVLKEKTENTKEQDVKKTATIKIMFTDLSITKSFNCLYTNESLMKKLELEIGSLVYLKTITNPNFEADTIQVSDVGNEVQNNEIKLWSSLKLLEEDVVSILRNNFSTDCLKSNVLVIGSSGCGKTMLLQSVSNIMEKEDSIYCVRVDCKLLKGKKIESLEKIFTEKLSTSAYHQPSLLLLDSLDCISGLTLNNDQESPFGINYINKLSSMLLGLLSKFQSTHDICVIASAQNLSKLGDEFNSNRGPRFFAAMKHIAELNKTDRIEILDLLLNNRFDIKQRLLTDVVDQTENYNVQDLSDLVDKICLKSLVRTKPVGREKVEVSDEDVKTVLLENVPLSLKGVNLNKDVEIYWEDVGGLIGVKETLIEMLEWSSKYSTLFDSCPLRHQSGILLYGAPGTGKTLIAGAAANKCKLNFISVKGPELLSKYIGASEEGVRNLFDRAQKAKPCILYFDEFDSLAPRRGHDSTGVTDRVVNQLLTQLDGVESLNGVWVIAATSRPDLLDPALLRPGRLDRALHCPLPDKDDRLSILSALSRKVPLADVDLVQVAEATDGFTGADLHAVFYNAQTSALNEIVANSDASDVNDLLRVRQKHILDAVSGTKPSLSQFEKIKYRKIYERFVSTGGNEFSDQSGQQKKVTLA